MIGIRQRIMIGFGSLLAVIIFVGLLTISQINRLGQTPGVILKENYRSVIACQEMKESLERMDSGILFTLAGRDAEGGALVSKYASHFRAALDAEKKNITLPGEREKAEQIGGLFEKYLKAVPLATEASRSPEERQNAYFSTLEPLFLEIKDLAQEILTMNQANMVKTDAAARSLAGTVRQKMLSGIILSAFIALVFSILAQKWILRPVNRLIQYTKEIGRGNFDIVLDTGTNDEIGRLSQSFNEMAAALRHVRVEDRANLMRGIRATEEVFKILPEAVAVLDLEGRVQISTDTAQNIFGFKPGILATDLGYDWLPLLIQQTIYEERTVALNPLEGVIQRFAENRELFFQPMAVPIFMEPGRTELTGFALILRDVTQVHEQRELKRGVLSTVLHQLRTPLTSLRLSVHLLVEERVGTLNEKQTELLNAAKEDSERLVNILDDLLNLHRIESDKSHISPKPVSPQSLVQKAVECFLTEAKNKGVTIVNTFTDDLPEIMVDPEKVGHVFTNLISNALRHTGPGGTIKIGAKAEPDFIRFSIQDTGEGIPAEHLDRVFEPFYRVPAQKERSGTGLGLAIVKEIVEAHGGKVGVESKTGKGCTFHFTLPFFVG